MKRYPCIGGPLSGLYVTSAEMRPEARASRDFGHLNWKAGDVISPGGVHGSHAGDYFQFNRADGRSMVPTMVWLHRSLLENAGISIASKRRF